MCHVRSWFRDWGSTGCSRPEFKTSTALWKIRIIESMLAPVVGI